MNSILDLVSQIAQEYDLPQWLVISGPIVIFFMVIFLIFLAFKIMEPCYRLYKEDMFYNVIWRWNWKGSEVIDLWCFCPTCKAMLFVDDENCRTTTMLNEKITFFVCHDCGEHEKGRLKGGDRRYVLNVVKRDIAAKVRHKTFDIYERR
jgi:uncharacterized protein YlaI